jgi:hypothetical protein
MECDVTPDQRASNSSPYSVICPRCETLSSVEESACPFCGADRHGAVLTRGAETAVRAVEAARGVTRRFREYGEAGRAEKRLGRLEGNEPRLPAPAATLDDRQRTSNSVLATVAMAGVVLGICVIARAYFENREPLTRAVAMPVAVAGAVREAPPPAIEAADRLVETRPADAARPAADKPSPVIPVVASSKDSTRQAVVAERPVAKKGAAPRAQTSHKAVAAKAPGSRTAASCNQKSDRACAKTAQRNASKAAPKQQKTASKPQPQRQEAARSKPGAKDFQKVAAIPAPVKPAMTADGSWKPGKKN